MMVRLSVIVPVYFNAPTLEPLHEKIRECLENRLSESELEIVFVDDGSGDDSFKILCDLAEKDRGCVRVLRLSRNFGSHPAILAGLRACSGRYAAVLGADLQDDPAILVDMLDEAEQAHKDVVVACRETRRESPIKRGFASLYYWLMRTLSDAAFPSGGFDCYLIERRVIDSLVAMNEANTSLAAQVLWVGFRSGSISYVKEGRAEGKSRWTLRKKIKLLVDSLISFSRLPVRLMEITGLLMALLSGLYAIVIVFLYAGGMREVRGWASLMVVLLFVAGIGFLSLGIIGEYLWRILDAARGRPTYIIAESRNAEYDRLNAVPSSVSPDEKEEKY